MNFAKRLKSLREENNIKQIELAKALKMTSATLSQYEKGIREPNNQTLVKIAEFFDVSVDYLLGRTLARKQVDTLAFHSIEGYENLSDEDRQYIDDLIDRLNKKND